MKIIIFGKNAAKLLLLLKASDQRTFLNIVNEDGDFQMATYLPVLVFHDLDENPSVTSFSPNLFRQSMARLNESGYRSLSLEKALELMGEDSPLPERTFVLTFDDGYKSVYNEAFPVLDAYGMTATVFLTTGTIGPAKYEDRLPSQDGRTMLSWNEILKMHHYGIDFGAHTLTHPNLTKLNLEVAQTEICESKAIIEYVLNAPAKSFAYPYGLFDSSVQDIVKQHFVCACSDKLGLVTKDSDPYAIERVDTYYFKNKWLFDIISSRLLPFYVLVRSVPRQIKRAFKIRQY